MEIQLLKDRDVFPSEEALAGALGGVYPVYEAFMQTITGAGLIPEWRYYNDGGAWLCKVTRGGRKTPETFATPKSAKTVFWLSVWESCFRVSFFFLERHLEGLAALGLDESSLTPEKEWGKMIPLIFNVRSERQFPDLLKVIGFKKTAK